MGKADKRWEKGKIMPISQMATEERASYLPKVFVAEPGIKPGSPESLSSDLTTRPSSLLANASSSLVLIVRALGFPPLSFWESF